MSSKKSNKPLKSGLFLVDKPRDYASHDIIVLTRKALNVKKIGHSGTLDPMASGLLLLLVGREATKQQDYFLKQPKTYRALLQLGTETDSWDAYGEETAVMPVPPLTLEQISAATHELTGEVEQPIPFYSAKKIGGKRMYELARNGHEMERRYNTVQIYNWQDVRLVSPTQIEFTVVCSCGTYVRALGWLLAQKLGTTGHLCELRRLKIGDLDVQNAMNGALIKESTPGAIYSRLIDVPGTPAEENHDA